MTGQLADLARLRVLSMQMAEQTAALKTKLCAEPSVEAVELCATLDLSMDRITRSVRRLVALEQEVAGFRDPKSMAAWKSRNRETARTLRASVGREVKHQLPGTDKESLKSLLSDLFRDYDDYDDYERGQIGPLVDRVTERLSRQGWQSFELPDEAELERLISEELDRIAKAQQENGMLPGAAGAEHPPLANGHDPP